MLQSKKQKCTCKNNKCIQGYCVCFKNSEYCSAETCDCSGCQNSLDVQVATYFKMATQNGQGEGESGENERKMNQ